jgi:hypothetical protein
MLVANNAGRNDDGGGKTKLLPRPVNRLNRLGAAQLVDCKWVAIHTVEKQADNTGLYPDCLFRQLWEGIHSLDRSQTRHQLERLSQRLSTVDADVVFRQAASSKRQRWAAERAKRKQARKQGSIQVAILGNYRRRYTHLTEVKPGISLNASASASAPLPPMALFAKLPAVSLSGEQQI